MTEQGEKQKIGRLGEDIAKKYLENKGFSVIDQNYLKKYGEIDIVAKKGGKLHFIEVKSVSEPVGSELAGLTAWPQTLGRSETPIGIENVSHETNGYRPEDNVHKNKLKRLARTIQVYLLEKYSNNEPEWFFDVITVEIDIKRRKSNVKFIENIVL